MKHFLLTIIVVITALAAKAQTAQNLVLYPSPTPMNSTLNVQYDLYNNTSTAITGVISTSVKINNAFKGVMHSQTLPSPLPPGQSVTINFSINVTPADFVLGSNIIIIFPTGSVVEGPTGGEASSTVMITQAQ